MALNATSVRVGKRNIFFLFMCSRNCIIIIIIIIIININCDNVSKSPSEGNFFWLLLL